MTITQQFDPPRFQLLLIDDSPGEIRLLIEQLRSLGYGLSIALDGEQGYQRAVSLQPDLILLDANMPRMNGFALCRKLQATPATALIPVIFLSAAYDIESRLEGLRGGARDYVTKPYCTDEILAKIRLHLTLAPHSWASPDEAQPEGPAGSASYDSDRALVHTAKRYIDSHLSVDFSLEDLARLSATNAKRLTLAFRRSAGTTVFEYVRQARMLAAQRMLAESGLSVVAIAEELGFSSAANFASAFNKYSGVTPSLYRQLARKGNAPPGRPASGT